MQHTSANQVHGHVESNATHEVGYGWLVICAILFALIVLPVVIL